MCDNLQSICLIIALDKGLTVSITQTKHTIHQLGDTIRILSNALPHILLLIIRQFHIRCRQYLCKTRNDIQRRTYLVGDIADKLGLHLRRDSSPLISDPQLFVHLLLSDGRTLLQVNNGTVNFTHELTNAESARLQQALGNSNLSNEDKQRAVATVINGIIVSRQMSQNYQQGIDAQENQSEIVQRK